MKGSRIWCRRWMTTTRFSVSSHSSGPPPPPAPCLPSASLNHSANVALSSNTCNPQPTAHVHTQLMRITIEHAQRAADPLCKRRIFIKHLQPAAHSTCSHMTYAHHSQRASMNSLELSPCPQNTCDAVCSTCAHTQAIECINIDCAQTLHSHWKIRMSHNCHKTQDTVRMCHCLFTNLPPHALATSFVLSGKTGK